MEGMNQARTAQFDLSMGIATHRIDESDAWKERKLGAIGQSHNRWSKCHRRNTAKSLIPTSEDHKTQVLASLVPDEIIYNCNDYAPRHYNACLLFGDVSGFTDLCEMYNKTGNGGPSRLTQVLNNYIGSMVQEILSHNGDILKFSGDAFLAMWKCDSTDSMKDTVHAALDSAIMIQKTFGTYETDVGVFLRVKLAIAAGYIVFSLIGDESMSHYCIVGQPILDVKSAEKKSHAGEIIVSASAWNYVNSNDYLFEQVGDGIHTKVKGVGPNWRPSNRQVGKRQLRSEDEDEEYSGSSNDSIDSETLGEFQSNIQINNEEFSIRPSVNYASNNYLREDLRKYVLLPVMRGIDLDEPLEYLTEMRQIVISFINVVVIAKLDLLKYVQLVDSVYKIVCHLVNDMEGSVNKVSLFDKDLMIVLLFGLKGYKSDLESQVGLYCASKCYSAISELNDVVSTSVAVTTGITYCGVVGHTLRREYTVIGLTVNKAARLMCAYPNKVTCDRETFLHSKLEARHFILQEFKPLKGIVNVGPIYEFKDEELTLDNVNRMNPFPILGRSSELKLYLKLLTDCVEAKKGAYILNYHSALAIRSEARLGKTRLVEEFIYITPPNIPVHRLTLSQLNQNCPYYAIQRMLSMPLSLHDSLSAEDRTAKLKLRLQDLKSPDFLCTLNKVFNVDFKKSAVYLSLTAHERVIVLQKILKQLCYIAFNNTWVIIIDNGEFIDDESWNLLGIILETSGSFIVITLCNKVSEECSNALINKRIRILDLLPIDKWYLAGVACQVLNVHAIPSELEKLIQSSSNGNPGWIESFLISLLQSGGLLIRHLFKEEVFEVGLVTPPEEMLTRMPESAESNCEINASVSRIVSNENDAWDMYQYSFRDSGVNIIKENNKGMTSHQGRKISVCIIAPGYTLNEENPELSMNVIVIQMFDSLTSFEQLLLKCSSVLGEFFPRSMLLYILGAADLRSTALAVKKLFELRVLSCAEGDFTQGDLCMMFTQRLINPNQDIGLKCECRGILIDINCHDLPKYASCGFLRFRLRIFRDTTYNLLTDNQKKEFHNKAIRYLENETKRCRSCGNGIFIKMLGTRHEDGFLKASKRKVVKATQSNRSSYMAGSISHTGESISSTHGSFAASVVGQFPMNLYSRDQRQTQTQKLLSSSQGQYCFGLRTMKSLKESYSLTRTFSCADFNSCQCSIILNTMYIQMLEHCRGAAQGHKLISAMLEYAYICIVSYNIPQALKILEDSTEVVDTLYKPEIQADEVEWRIPLIRGKIETLIGYARLELGQIKDAYVALHQALSYYGLSFPSRTITIKWHIKQYEWKRLFDMYCLPGLTPTNMDKYESEFNDNVSECLSILCHVYKEVHMWNHAELAAIWSLNRSIASDMDFFGLCTAYANMLDIAVHMGKQQLGSFLEVYALKLCHRKIDSVELQELRAVSELYSSIFYLRFTRAEIDRAIHIGYITLKICTNIHAINLSINVIPTLVQTLLMNAKVLDAVTLIMELEYCSFEDTDNTGLTWYYCLSVCLILETGYTLIPFEMCEQFYQLEGETIPNIRDVNAERRYYTVIWLWHVRNDNWEAAAIWYKKVKKIPIIYKDDSLDNIFTSLYLLEGLLLCLVSKVGKRNLKAVSIAYKEINNLISILEKISKKVKVIAPRLMHLKAYYQHIRDSDQTVFNMLNKAKKFAIKQENILEVGWIEHSEKAWVNNLPSIVVHFWKEHCEPDNILNYHEVEFNDGKIGYFTLPTPLLN